VAKRPDRVAQAIQRLPVADLRRFVDSVAAVLYWDPEENAWDPDKEWKGADFLDMINGQLPPQVLEAIRKR